MNTGIFEFIIKLQEITGNPVIFGEPTSHTKNGEPYLTCCFCLTISRPSVEENYNSENKVEDLMLAMENKCFEIFLSGLAENEPVTLRTLPSLESRYCPESDSFLTWFRVRLHQNNFNGVIKPEGAVAMKITFSV